MRFDQLTLTNFRGFESLEIAFDPHVTVLLGGNMSGKTAVLEGAAVALGEFLGGVARQPTEMRRSYRPIAAGEVRKIVHVIGDVPDLQAQSPVSVGAHAFADGQRWRWTRDLVDSSVGSINSHGNSLARAVQLGTARDLPVLALYGTQRVWRAHTATEPVQGIGNRFDGYADCLDIGATHAQLAEWMKKQTMVQLQRGSGYHQPQLAAVEAAVCACIGDVTRFWFDIQYDEVRLERTGGDLQSFGMLSDGYRNMVAMVADLAWRASVLNPQFGAEAHLRAEGVVMIDELELHLHPAWQRRVVDDLRRTFPLLQFIVTTHSPQVVASVARSQVRLLDRNRLIASDLHVEGRDSNAILEDIFGVPSRPASAQAELDALYRLIEDEDFAMARVRLATLSERLGPDDAEIARARWILDTEAVQHDGPAAAAP